MQGTLRRELTRCDFLMIRAGGVLGLGWLFGALYSAHYADPGAVSAWTIGGILMLVLGLPYAELASAFPESGSMVRCPPPSHGSFLSSLQAWSLRFGYGLSPVVEAEAAVQCAGGFVHGLCNGKTLTTLGADEEKFEQGIDVGYIEEKPVGVAAAPVSL